jgi:hypothetical protein
LSLTLTADQLLTHGNVTFESVTVDGGLTLQSPVISATATVQTTGSNSVEFALTSFQLQSGTVDVEAAGLDIPDFVLSALMGEIEFAVNNPPAQTWILNYINSHI